MHAKVTRDESDEDPSLDIRTRRIALTIANGDDLISVLSRPAHLVEEWRTLAARLRNDLGELRRIESKLPTMLDHLRLSEERLVKLFRGKDDPPPQEEASSTSRGSAPKPRPDALDEGTAKRRVEREKVASAVEDMRSRIEHKRSVITARRAAIQDQIRAFASSLSADIAESRATLLDPIVEIIRAERTAAYRAVDPVKRARTIRRAVLRRVSIRSGVALACGVVIFGVGWSIIKIAQQSNASPAIAPSASAKSDATAQDLWLTPRVGRPDQPELAARLMSPDEVANRAGEQWLGFQRSGRAPSPGPLRIGKHEFPVADQVLWDTGRSPFLLGIAAPGSPVRVGLAKIALNALRTAYGAEVKVRIGLGSAQSTETIWGAEEFSMFVAPRVLCDPNSLAVIEVVFDPPNTKDFRDVRLTVPYDLRRLALAADLCT
jgi:hypothetical protein